MKPVKFCGISREEDIDCINTLPVAAVGFVFVPYSRRSVSDSQAARLKKRLRKDIAAIGVFVDEPIDHILALAADQTIDAIQLHGHEDAAYIRQLQSRCPLPVIQAFAVRSEKDLQKAENSPADWILLDAPVPGSGAVFDWACLKNRKRPFLLAGGLTPQNAAKALGVEGVIALDVSSGIETDGRKDPAKMKAFLEALEEPARTVRTPEKEQAEAEAVSCFRK